MTRTKNKFVKGFSVLLSVLIGMTLPGGVLKAYAETTGKVTLGPMWGDITFDKGKITQDGHTFYGYDVVIAGPAVNGCSIRVHSLATRAPTR